MARVRIRLQAKLDVKVQAKVAIQPEQIVQAALDLLDEVGLEGLTMRRLAEKLDIKAASLYWHVKDKDELLVLLADRICAEIQPPDPSLPWREQFQRFADEYRRVLLSHRDGARVLAQSGPPSGESRLNLVEVLLGVMLKAGFSPKDAAFAGFLVNDYITTFVIEESRYTTPPEGQPIPDEGAENWMDALPADKYPNVVALAPHWLNVNLNEQFRFGCDVIADGLERRLKSS